MISGDVFDLITGSPSQENGETQSDVQSHSFIYCLNTYCSDSKKHSKIFAFDTFVLTLSSSLNLYRQAQRQNFGLEN